MERATSAESSIRSISEQRETLRVEWGDGRRDEFYYFWLRDHCPCTECRHPDTRERIQDPLAWPLDVRPTSTRLGDRGELCLTWEDGHESRFAASWLAENRCGEVPEDCHRPLETWNAEMSDHIPEFDHDSVMSRNVELLEWLRALDRFGLAILKGCPGESLTVLRIADRIGFARPTNFGLHFDVDSKPEPINNAYTALALPAHTDLPNWSNPPGFQLLHCLVHEATGGDSIFVDGARGVEVLGQESPEDLDLLSSVPIDFRFHDDSSDVRFRSPVITWHDGRLSPLRHNHGILDTVRVPFEQTAPLYRAHRRFTSILARRELRVECRLTAGDLVMFDNHRVLHGRTAFDPQSGNRRFQGCYVDHDPFLSRLRVLERAHGD